jgi:hypothetical protein
MTAPFYPSRLLQVGIGKETTYAVAVTPAYTIPAAGVTAPDNVGLLSDAGWRGAPANSYGETAGPLDSSVTIGGPIYPDTIGYPLAGVLGDVAFAGGSPNTWTAALLNSGTQQPPSYTLTVADPIGQLAYAGCKFQRVQLVLSPDALLTWTGTVAGLVSAAASVSMPAATSELPLAGWQGVVTIAGVTDTRLLSADITIDRTIVPKRNVDGSQGPYLQRSDVLAVTGNLNFAVVADTYHQDQLAATAVALDLNFSRGAGAGLRQLLLHMSKAYFVAAPRSYGNKWIELAAAFRADHNSTDVGASGGYSPMKVTVKNTVGSGSYA